MNVNTGNMCTEQKMDLTLSVTNTDLTVMVSVTHLNHMAEHSVIENFLAISTQLCVLSTIASWTTVVEKLIVNKPENLLHSLKEFATGSSRAR